MSDIRHVMGISGGKDSAALSVYLRQKYPNLGLEYYFCDTGKELNETYDLVNKLEITLGVGITQLKAAKSSHKDPFDHFLEVYGGFLPSANARWCTKKLKLEPFEEFVGDDPVVSYVGIRGDEDREGYISKKPNIQSIFPFRRNIWSQDVIRKVLVNETADVLFEFYRARISDFRIARVKAILETPLSRTFNQDQKLIELLELGTKEFNWVVHQFIKGFTDYPLSRVDYFPLVDNDEVLVREDIFRILRESGVGIPSYYKELPFDVNGKKGKYFRSRSGCFFCFFQQKIEWVWLYEQNPEEFQKAMDYEKAGYSWMDNERLEDLIKPDRIEQIKSEFLEKSNTKRKQSSLLIDILDGVEGEGCAACFI